MHATVMEITRNLNAPYWLGLPITIALLIVISIIIAAMFFNMIDNPLRYFASITWLFVPILFLIIYYTEDECNINNKIESNNVVSTYKPNYQNLCVRMQFYEDNFVESVNTGDFDKVKDSLKANSSLYKAQKSLVQNLYSRGIKEEIKRIEYLHIKRIKDRKFEVTTREQILVEDEKGERLTDHKWTYTVIWDKTNHEFYLTKIKKAS